MTSGNVVIHGTPGRVTSTATLDLRPCASERPRSEPDPVIGRAQRHPMGSPLPVPLPLSSWGRRAGANVLDGLFSAWPLCLGLVYLITTLQVQEIPYDGWAGLEILLPSMPGAAALVLGYTTNSGLSLWNRMYRQGRTGQSVGKKAMGIRLVSETHLEPIGPSNAYMRDLAHALDVISLAGYLMPLWDAKRQTFADRIMKSVVVDA